MDLSSFEPARPAGLERPSAEAEALNKVARALGGTSVSKMAGTFSTPVQYNHDANFLQAQQRQLSPSAPSFSPVQPPRMRQTRQETPQTFIGSMADQYMGRLRADRDEYARQERRDRVRQQRQARQPQAEPQPQPEYSSTGQYTGPDVQVERGPQPVTIGQRPAQAPWGRTAPSRPTFPVGMSPEDKIHQTAQKSADDLGIGSIYRGRQGQTQTPGTLASSESLEQLRNRLSGNDYEGPWKEGPAQGGTFKPDVTQNVSNGQFGTLGQPNGKPRSDTFNSDIRGAGMGHPSGMRDEIGKAAEDIGKGALDAGEMGAI